ncbi:hypothetical protein VTO42DRAFT_4643 [Malbranchea cinnamomea]
MAVSDDSIYFYDPSFPASIVFTILYALPAAFLSCTTVIGPRKGKYRHAKFFIPLVIGAWIEVAAYLVRCFSVEEPESVPLYAVSLSLMVIAPVFICASLYMLIGQLIRSGIPKRGKQQYILVELLRLTIGKDDRRRKRAQTSVIACLALQLVTFSFFLLIVRQFHVRAKRFGSGIPEGVRKVLTGLYVAGFFIDVG